MRRPLIALAAVGFVVVGTAGLGLWAKWNRDRNRAATDAELQAEREADREELRAAFANPAAPTPEDAAEFGRFFAALQTDIRGRNEAVIGARVDADRMVAETDRLGLFARSGIGRPSARDREKFVAALRGGIVRLFLQDDNFRWDSTRLRFVRWATDRREAVVLATHREEIDGEQIDVTLRWWLTGGPGAWRVYDVEALDLGNRITRMLVEIMSPELVRQGPAAVARLQGAMAAIRDAVVAACRNDPAAADRALAPTRGLTLPPLLAAYRELAEAGIPLARWEGAAALARLDAADRLYPGMPVVTFYRARALNMAKRYAEALDAARGYAAEVGPDAATRHETAFALHGLGRRDEAAAEYARSLDDDPDYYLSLTGLRRALPDDRKAEVRERLAKARDPGFEFDAMLAAATKDGDHAGAAALRAGLRKARPDDPRVAPDVIRELVTAGNTAEAAAVVRRHVADLAAGSPLPAVPQAVLATYLEAMADAGRAVEALAAVPPARSAAAFRLLAERLERRHGAAPKADDPDDPADPLAGLIAARRKAAPGDPWTWLHEGNALAAAGRHADALKAYTDADAALAKWDGPVTDADRDRFRAGRVRSLYRTGQPRAARAVGPADKTYRQLAWLYADDRDADGLAGLNAAHAKTAPADRALVFFRGEVQFQKGEYQAAAGQFADYRRGLAADAEPSPSTATDREFRARVRDGDLAGARRVYEEPPPRDRNHTFRAVLAAAGGDAAELGRVLDELSTWPGGWVAFLYNDADFPHLIAAPAFAELRRKYPDPRPRPPGPNG